MDAVTTKIQNIISKDYSTAGYVELVKEVLPDVTLVAPDNFRDEKSNFSYNIDGYYHIGNYKTADNRIVIIAAVQVAKHSTVEIARSIQRNYAKKLIQNSSSAAAFVAFYTPNESSWRISFVCLDTSYTIENGRLKTTEEMTPAKRYSFLVGLTEPYHTAVDRLLLLAKRADTPKLSDIEEAFSVEKVTKDFYELYCEKFHQLREHLDANRDFVEEAKLHNFTSAQFAKKLMGQIVFLYFLQKKGWLGVKAWPNTMTEKEYKNAIYARGTKSRELIPLLYKQVAENTYRISSKAINEIRDEDEKVLSQCVKGNPWGTGPQDFMRRLFEIAKKKGENFFDTYLEPLFYDALNVNRGEQGYCQALHCRIPFLSGGLFEPIDGYDWEHNDFAIPNEIFSNRINGNSRTGDGILDIFDRYNFTMSEDEPMEREVAIDPEMLGKVFENLLDVSDRHTRGAFYTPREIVHYMCQESLINYLTRVMSLPEKDIRDFVLYSDFMKDQDSDEYKRKENGGLFISDRILKLNVSGKVEVNRLDELDAALKNVRVADPAVGSGAFPLGMLNEIVKARNAVTEYMIIAKKSLAISKEQGYAFAYNIRQSRSQYILKKETIRDCIYAADIEPSAVDIAQLRLWLSLVIDDEINPNAKSEIEGHRNPTPLPNLESNILCGNSLIDVFKGIKLINPSELLGTTRESQQINLGQEMFDSILENLIKEQRELFYCDNTEKKQQHIENISYLRDQIILHQLDGASAETIGKYEETKRMVSKPYVLWQLDFARVFREKGGFDIVIGNPPYVQLQTTINEETGEKLGDQYQKCGFETFEKTGDIYCLFYEKGYRLLCEGGVLTFITSNKWMRAGYGKALREFFVKKTNPLSLIDFAGAKIFESATVDVNILITQNSTYSHATKACNVNEECKNNLSVYFERNNVLVEFPAENTWFIIEGLEAVIKSKVEALGIPLKNWNIEINYGIKTGLNDAFIISQEKYDELVANDFKSAEIIRPILRGRDIKKYTCDYRNLYLICTFPSRNYDINDYPAIKEYLLSFGIERLEQTGKSYVINGNTIKARKKTNNKWYETQDSISYWDDFFKQKIIYPNMTKFMPFYLDTDGYVTNQKCFIITGERLGFLTAFLNSSLFKYCFRNNFPELLGGTRELSKIFFDNIPVIQVSEAVNIVFEEKVKCIQAMRRENQSTEIFEKEIDRMIFDLYNLTKEEQNAIGYFEIT